MKLLIEAEDKEAYVSLTDDHPADLPAITVDDILPISVTVLQRISAQWDSKIFAPVDVSAYMIRAAIGGFLPPVSGTFPLTYSSETGTTLASYDPTASELENILNAIDTIDIAGEVDVTGDQGFFVITFREVGARSLIQADAGDLVPVSAIEINQVVIGDGSTREVQTLEIRQDTGAIVELTDDTATPDITVDEVQLGDGTHNHIVRVSLPADRWGGSFTFSASSDTSDPISYSPSQEEFQSAIESMAAIGENNVSVVQETENDFLITFRNGRGHQAIATIDADAAGLKVILTKSGELDLTASNVTFLIPEGDEEALVKLEIESTPSGGSAQKILERDILLRRAVIAV